MIIPVILSGGSGTRLWPLSRTLYPKQFMHLLHETTLFQDSILRLPKNTTEALIVCNEEHRFLAAEQLRQIGKKPCGIILEPTGKNTAPAVALAALKFANNSKDPILLVLSSDHLIQNNKAFHKSIKIATSLAEQGKLVTFGVVPTKTETGYGYIEANIVDNAKYYDIKSFKEKPKKNKAQHYLEAGNYFWNSGIFMFKASIYLNELDKFKPEIVAACRKSLQTEYKDLDFIRLNNKEFNQCPTESIDYAVMEHTKDGIVIPLDCNWNDIGSWSTLWNVKPKDKNNNVTEGDVMLEDVNNTYIHGSKRLISAIGVSNLAIIDTKDALLVTDKKYSQKINNIVEKLRKNNRVESMHHQQVYRPWGFYDLIDSGKNFQVKRISVNPAAKLSLQKHQYRSEHWVVVKGVALITRGDDVFKLVENQSTYIPTGKIHRLENREDSPLEIIEIQTGDYLGEDDIIRLDDEYQRN